MSDNIENLVLEHLRGLRNQIEALQAETRADFQEVKHRLTGVESGVAGLRRDSLSTQEDVYRQQAAIDRINERIQRIEKRLELAF
jgi:predicted  nucleic acid-binding Zn-ribbon protein